jgi:oleandomycin transport system ATP-binding protein
MQEVTGRTPTPEADKTLLTVPVDDPGVMSAAVRRLEEQRIDVHEFAIRLPSLDDVFLTLTGHKAEDPASKEGKAA